MHRGYVKLWRKTLESEVWDLDNPLDIKLWMWILMSATHKPVTLSRMGIDLAPGELVTSYPKLQAMLTRKGRGFRKRYAPTVDQLRCSMHRLCEVYVVSMHRATPQGGLLVKVLHWEEYQQTETAYTSDYTPHQSRTNPAYAPQDKKVKKEEEVKPLVDSLPKNGNVSTSVREVFAYWQNVMGHPTAKLIPGKKRARAIEARLKDGYTVEDIKSAVDGCRATPHNMGKNDRHTVYDDIELICRDEVHLESFLKPKPMTDFERMWKEL